MGTHRIVLSAAFLGVGFLLTLAWAVEQPPSLSLTLEQALHFTAPDGNPVVLEPGSYAVEAGETGIRFIKGPTAVLVQTQATTHTEQLSTPTALLIPGEGDIRHVVLLLPDGQARDAIGSLSGVQSRGATGYQVLGANQIALSAQQLAVLAAMAQSGRSGMFLQGGTQVGPPVAATPTAPILLTPGPSQVVRGPLITFTWNLGSTSASPQSFQVCVEDMHKDYDPRCRTAPTVVAGSARSFSPPGGLLDAYRGRTLWWWVAACYPGNPATAPGQCFASSSRQFVAEDWTLPAPPTSEPHLRFSYALIPATPGKLQEVAAVTDYTSLRRLAGTQYCQFVGDVRAPNHGVQVIWRGREHWLAFDIVGSVPGTCTTGAAVGINAPVWDGELRWMLMGFAFDYYPDRGPDHVSTLSNPSQTVQFRSIVGGVQFSPQDFRLRYGWNYLRNVAIGAGLGSEVSGSFGFLGFSADNNWILVVFDGTFRLNNVAWRDRSTCTPTGWSCLAVNTRGN